MRKEREHELDGICGSNNHGIVNALRECELFKIFQVPSMRDQIRLLEYILMMWNHEKQHFEVRAHILTAEVEKIYFLVWLSKR